MPARIAVSSGLPKARSVISERAAMGSASLIPALSALPTPAIGGSMPLQVGVIRGRQLRHYGDHHCTGSGRTLSEEQAIEPPMVPKPAVTTLADLLRHEQAKKKDAARVETGLGRQAVGRRAQQSEPPGVLRAARRARGRQRSESAWSAGAGRSGRREAPPAPLPSRSRPEQRQRVSLVPSPLDGRAWLAGRPDP